MVSDKYFDNSADEPASGKLPRASGSAWPLRAQDPTPTSTPAGDPLAAVRRMYGSKFDVPQALREGAIAHRFGADDIDAVHAAKLKAVQNAAFLRAAWMTNAVANDLDIGDPRPRWAMFVNGIAEDLHAARIDAAQAGVDSADIEHADKVGASGLAWEQQPAHRLLGRLEDLSHELYHLGSHNAEQAERIRHLTQRLDTAEAAIDALGDTVAQQEVSLRELLGEVVDHHWNTSRPEVVHAPQSLARLRDANTILAAANTVDALDLPQPRDSGAPAGTDIGTAVEVAMAGIDPPTSEDPALAAPPVTPQPSATTESELEP